MIHAEQDFLLGVGTSHLVWIDLYGTRLGTAGRRLLVAHLDALRPLLVKVAIVGARRTDARRLPRTARRGATPLPVPTRFLADPEAAKVWLVRGRS
ncbi:hypothetical protein [Cellulosimicrobium cellulans]|uniref:hypothetical protein n=1 Tax=Cellulosimicrobium cellulans TaxID=1710 RepID=UPI0016520040|nr:hypothetical protein [Cellulosimicrobium cellulans]